MSKEFPISDSALLKQIIDKKYPVVDYGEGVFLYDTEGRQYLDGSSGAMAANIGHGVDEIAAAVSGQCRRVAFTYRTQFTSQPAEELARRLTDIAPGDLDKAFFVNSGSEASEFAIRTAVSYWRDSGLPGKVKILGRTISYHGMTMGALSMSGHAARRPDYGSLLHSFSFAPPAYAYRLALPGESEEAYAERAAKAFEEAIKAEDAGTVAAVIVEPIVGAAGGVLTPPAGYFSRLREICDRLDVLLIIDEVITGIGRTGDWFASSYENVIPDLLLIGKGMSAGYSPVAGVLMRRHVVEALGEGSGVAPFGHTFSGNPLGAATCLAVLDFMERGDVLANVRQRGKQLEEGLRSLATRYQCMADVRGRGLLWGFEFVMDQESKEAPDPVLAAATTFVQECLAQGLIVYPAGIAPLNNAAILAPPLVITEEETRILLAKLEEALRAMERHVQRWAPVAENRSGSRVGTGC
ncbi:aminotransferase class III-fold pyridoxal phosphate-dependent enzyme [Paenarthrobacter sp. AT5]|uniref:aminotransferase family protein n=1 Tax=Paenarthrobacter sp. AT5 TaxID=2973089 RepID=UPI000401280D|nr:aminotransferase class III-fold pyridoxal phosphate-dependent enzyme [Paenarthrobacter sp. AT5]WOC59505.1 aminotransferase class III-fold pyridoxal phosphate-dependent enzyme [Paenarthrobacter sp. AT5]